MTDNPMTSNIASALAKMRKTTTKTCPVCGRVFVARPVAIYCSAPCRMKAAYEARQQRRGVWK